MSGRARVYELKSAMHLPLLVLGLTQNTVRYARHLLSQKVFTADECEFFTDYGSYLDRKGLLGRDPLEETVDEDDLAVSRLATRRTLLEHATGLSPEAHLVEQWSHFFAHKS